MHSMIVMNTGSKTFDCMTIEEQEHSDLHMYGHVYIELHEQNDKD